MCKLTFLPKSICWVIFLIAPCTAVGLIGVVAVEASLLVAS